MEAKSFITFHNGAYLQTPNTDWGVSELVYWIYKHFRYIFRAHDVDKWQLRDLTSVKQGLQEVLHRVKNKKEGIWVSQVINTIGLTTH